jgi:pimeloyl-ACP methyl ester carboxylesterase
MKTSLFAVRKLFVFLTLISLFIPTLTVSAQRRSNSTVASNKAPAATKCSGAWTGTISYTRRQSQSDNKTVKRVSGRGEDTRNWEMKYDYQARVAVVEAPERNGSSVGKGTINHNFTSIETIDAVEKNSCDRGKTWQDMRGTSKSETATSGSATADANVSVGVNTDGTYSVSVGLPQISGTTKGSQNSSFSGQCTPKEGKTFNMPPTPTSIDGNSLTSDGKDRIDPANPNKLSGTYTSSWQNVTETITWSLQKCGAPLRITDLKFQDMKFPNWDDWQDISEQKGTIDGNWVKVKAKVLNASGETKYAEVSLKETYKGDKWDGARPDYPLKDNTVSVRLDAGEEREVEVLWDTSGFAWYDDGRPRLVQRVKAEVWENNKLADDMTKNIKIAPKPLVLVHGLWSSWKAWESWQNILTTSHSYDWKAFPVGEKPEKGVMNTGGEFLSTAPTNSIGENARELEKYIKYAQEDRNAWHVDIVAHSMGGLISRYYISQIMPANTPDMRPKVSHLIMLGTPNLGSPCADVINLAFELAGKQVEAVRQLQQDYVAGFNRINTNRKGVKFSALAGNPLPTMCKTIVWNDGVVSVPSAKWTIADTAESKSIHTELTGTSDFSSFVKPRLAIGPRGDHNPATPDIPTMGQMFRTIPNNYGAAIDSLELAEMSPAVESVAKYVKIEPKEVTEVEVPVSAVKNLGLTFMADPLVSLSLVNASGVVVGKNLAGSPESRSWFRSIFVDQPVAPANWKIKVENTSDREREVYIVLWSDATK